MKPTLSKAKKEGRTMARVPAPTKAGSVQATTRNAQQPQNITARRIAGSSGPARGVSLEQRVDRVNKWRDRLNPQRGLTMSRAVALFEAAMGGQHTELQWLYCAPQAGLECTDADSIALIELRTAALLDMETGVDIVENPSDPGLAAAQKQFLENVYNRIDNLYEAIEALEMAAFRGYAFVQPVDDEGAASFAPTRFSILPTWNFVRDGAFGSWYWNPAAQFVNAQSLGDENRIDFKRDFVLFRETTRPINRFALTKLVRQAMCDKDWDAFIEIFGIPQWLVIGPPNLSPERENQFAAAAEACAQGGSGYLPNGSDVKTPDAIRGVSPFEQRMRFLSEKHVLVGTGGMLTMLNDATGIGAGASSAHQETFRKIASGSARRISEVFNRMFDRRLLERQFPGQPRLAYFRIQAQQSTNVNEIADQALKFFQAGFRRDAKELSNETGMTLSEIPPASAGYPATDGARSMNRAVPATGSARPSDALEANATIVTDTVAKALGIQAQLLEPFFAQAEKIAQERNLTETEFFAALEEAVAQLPELLEADTAAQTGELLYRAMSTAVTNAIAARKERHTGGA